MSASNAALKLAPILDDVQTLQFPVDGEFNPNPLDAAAGETISLKYLGTGSAQVTIYDSNNEKYDLFAGSSNPYPASSDGTEYEIRDTTPEDTSYTVQYDDGASSKLVALGPTGISLVVVRGTINVKKPA